MGRGEDVLVRERFLTAGITAKNVDKFAPIALVSASPYVVVVNAKVPAANILERIDLARKNPGKLTFGSSGTGAASHLSAELFKSDGQVDAPDEGARHQPGVTASAPEFREPIRS